MKFSPILVAAFARIALAGTFSLSDSYEGEDFINDWNAPASSSPLPLSDSLYSSDASSSAEDSARSSSSSSDACLLLAVDARGGFASKLVGTFLCSRARCVRLCGHSGV